MSLIYIKGGPIFHGRSCECGQGLATRDEVWVSPRPPHASLLYALFTRSHSVSLHAEVVPFVKVTLTSRILSTKLKEAREEYWCRQRIRSRKRIQKNNSTNKLTQTNVVKLANQMLSAGGVQIIHRIQRQHCIGLWRTAHERDWPSLVLLPVLSYQLAGSNCQRSFEHE